MDAQTKRAGAIYSVALLVLLVIYYWPFLSGQAQFYRDDITAYYEPVIGFIARCVHHGQLPLWDPWNYCGIPVFAAASPDIWYPPNWLFLVMPFSVALATSLIAHQLCAGVGTFCLCVGLGLEAPAAIVAGVIYALSNYMFSLDENFSMVCAVAWIPWCLYFENQILAQKSLGSRSYAFLALSTALLIMSGRPEVFVPSAVLLVGCAAVSLWQTKSPRGLFSVVRAVSIGVLLSAPMLVPAIESLPWSIRQGGLAPEDVMQFSVRWLDLLGVLIAQPAGDLHLFWGPHLDLVFACPNVVQFISSLYLTPVSVALALAGILYGRTALRLWLLGGAALSLLISLGSTTPFGALVFSLPGASLLRYPSKAMCFFNLCICILAAFAIQKAPRQRCAMILGIVTAGVLALGVVAATNPSLVLQFVRVDCPTLSLNDDALNWLASQFSRASFTAAGVGLVGLLCLLSPRFSVAGTAALISLALTANAAQFLRHEAPAAFFSKSSFLADLLHAGQKGQDTAFQPRFMNFQMSCFGAPLNVMLANGKNDTQGATWRWFDFARQAMWRNANTDFSVPMPFGAFSSVEPATLSHLLWNAYDGSSLSKKYDAATVSGDSGLAFENDADRAASIFFRITSTKTISTAAYCMRHEHRINRLNPKYFSLISDNEDLNLRLYRVNNPLPRAYLTNHWQLMPNHKAVVDALMGNSFDPSMSTLLEEAPQIPSGQSGRGTETNLQGTIKCTKYQPNRVVFAVTASAPALFVLTDLYYPGWNAMVDGKSTNIAQANGFLRAVSLDGGSHTVVFDYSPKSLFAGLILFAIGALLLIMQLWKGRQRDAI